MNIPVFHDDQHGTAIIVAAAVRNWLRITGRDIDKVRLVGSGAGAAALACLDLLVSMGMDRQKILIADRDGIVHAGRDDLDDRKAEYARDTNHRTLGEALAGADLFLGLSAGGVVTPDMVADMADQPLIMALANPTPEILPELAIEAKPDAIIATGRSDYANQVNNVLCFPFIFRGALDVGATVINEAMKLACVEALAELALAESSDVAQSAYGGREVAFGADYLIPRPFDPRLIVKLAPAVAKAAMESGVATRPIADLDAYRRELEQFVFRSVLVMRHIFSQAAADPKRVVYCEGEDDRVLSAVQVVLDEGFAKPILLGRPDIIERRVERLGLRIRAGQDCEIVNPEDDPRYHSYWTAYHKLMERRGVSPDAARTRMRTNFTVIGVMMVHQGDADAVVCGTVGRYARHLLHVQDILGLAPGVRKPAAMNVLILSAGTYFVCDTYVNADPDAEDIADAALMAAEQVRRFGLSPKLALLSHSNFGTHHDPAAAKMREALALIEAKQPNLEVEGEMHADAAISPEIRARTFPNSRLEGPANVLVMPSMDAANISFNLLKVLGDGISIGPVLLGAGRPAHIVTPSITVRGLVNITALATVDAQTHSNHSVAAP